MQESKLASTPVKRGLDHFISERAKRASSVMFVFNRDFRYVYIYMYIYIFIYMWPYVNLYAHARITLLRNGLSN